MRSERKSGWLVGILNSLEQDTETERGQLTNVLNKAEGSRFVWLFVMSTTTTAPLLPCTVPIEFHVNFLYQTTGGGNIYFLLRLRPLPLTLLSSSSVTEATL